ncbi:MAG: helix-turn-helix transcriptional regulator [Elusimicrobiota bacterium]
MDNNSPLAKSYGMLLRDIRAGANLSVAGFARMVGTSTAWLSYIERDERIPSWPFVQSCLEALGKHEDVSAAMLERLRQAGKKLVLQKAFSIEDVSTGAEMSPVMARKNGHSHPSRILRHSAASSVHIP